MSSSSDSDETLLIALRQLKESGIRLESQCCKFFTQNNANSIGQMGYAGSDDGSESVPSSSSSSSLRRTSQGSGTASNDPPIQLLLKSALYDIAKAAKTLTMLF